MCTPATSSRPPTGLRGALLSGMREQGHEPHAIVRAVPNQFTSRFDSSIVQVKLTGGEVLDVFSKWGPSTPPFAHSYYRGVAHEAEVYSKVLRRVGASAPRFFGSHTDDEGRTWLFIEYLMNARTVNRWPGVGGMQRAADWLARFHFESAQLAGGTSFLPRLATDYYAFWAARALEFTEPLHRERPWLPALLTLPEEVFCPLVEDDHVVVHGEFYPPNVLFDGEKVYPVDWECCAVAPAELDVAFLTEGWPSEVEALCLEAYEAAWPGGEARISRSRLAAAKAYLAVRYLGHKPGLAERQRGPQRLELLHGIARELGLGHP
jgi:aminoglycoside phosphotransferase (APT) family kinase protein